MCLLTICMNYVVHTNHIWKKCQVRFYAHLSIGLFFMIFLNLKKILICICMNHFAVHLKLAQHCK